MVPTGSSTLHTIPTSIGTAIIVQVGIFASCVETTVTGQYILVMNVAQGVTPPEGEVVNLSIDGGTADQTSIYATRDVEPLDLTAGSPTPVPGATTVGIAASGGLLALAWAWTRARRRTPRSS